MKGKKILIYRNGALGDTLVLWPMLKTLLANKFIIYLSVNEKWEKVLNEKNLYIIDSETALPYYFYKKNNNKINKFYKDQNFDYALIFKKPDENILNNLTDHGIKKENIFFKEPLSKNYNIYKYYFKCADLFNIQQEEKIYNIKPSQKRKKNKKVLIHPASSNPDKNIPLNIFIKLSEKLKKLGFTVNFILGYEDELIYSLLKKIINKENIIKSDSIDNLIESILSHYYFVGNDSGPAHLAVYKNSIVYMLIKEKTLWNPPFKNCKVINITSLI